MGLTSRRAIAVLLLGAGAWAQSGRRLRPQDGLVPDWVKAGPMIGHVGPHSARLWIRVAKGTKFGVRGSLLEAAGYRAVVPTAIRKRGDQVKVIEFASLPADTEMNVQIFQGEFPTGGVALTLRTAPLPARTGRVRIGFGSCCNDIQYPKAKVFLAAAEEKPDVFLFIGDNTYYVREYGVERTTKKGKTKRELRFDTVSGDGDWTSSKRMFARQMKTRTNPWLRPLLQTVPCYAVWDDHDFGPDNADRTFTGRKKSLRVFEKMWANPGFGVKGTKGCFSSFLRGPVEVFLMDDRYHKFVRTSHHPTVPADECTIWGAEQLAWLCEGLRKSAAPVKLIVNGTQFLSRSKVSEGHFREARVEYQRLLDYLDAHRIGGVVFLTGDRHHSEMMSLRRKNRPTIPEFTSSPLAWGQEVGALPSAMGTAAQLQMHWQLRGDNYGLVTVDVPARGDAEITCEVRDKNNAVPTIAGILCKTTWPLKDLNPK